MEKIKVTIEFSGAIKRPFPESEREFELVAGKNIREVLLDLGYSERDLKFLVAFRGETRIPLEELFVDGDRIKVLIPVGGG